MAPTRSELDRSLIQGLAWTGAIRWLGQLVSWGITFVVAHLLTPADYGLAGMAAVYTGFTLLLCEAGLTAALLRRSDSDTVAQAQLGGFAGLLGLSCCLLSLVLATPLSWFFGEPAVRNIVMVASIGFIFRGLQVLPRGILARRLDFRRLAWIDGIEALVLAGSTLTLALAGRGVWSLVLGSLSGAIAGGAASFIWCPQRLAWPRNMRVIAADVVFGSKVLGAQLAWYLYSNSDFAVVGWLLGPSTLGAYTLAWTIANMPVDRVSSLVSRVTPAYFATLSRDREQLRRYLLAITEGLALITFPACVGIALVAGDLVTVMLGPQWHAAVGPLRLLALVAATRSIFVLAPPILVFTGQVERNLWFSVACAVVLPVAFATAAHWGILAVAFAWVLVYPGFAAVYLFRHALRAVELSWSGYLRALRAPAVATLVMAVAVFVFGEWSRHLLLPLPRLTARIGIGAMVYSITTLVLRGDKVRSALGLLRGRGITRLEGATDLPAPRPRRLLVVSYHFPPDPAVGGLRWRKLAQHAVSRGWELDVISLDPGALLREDPSGLGDLPPGTRVHHVPMPALPFATLPIRCWQLLQPRRRRLPGAPAGASSLSARTLRWWPSRWRDLARAYFAWLDRHRGRAWGRAAADQARRILEQEEFVALISSGPPHPPHVPLFELARARGIPFVLDMRDPWGLLQRLPEAIASPLWLAQARLDERRCIRGAALTLTSTEPHRDALRRRYPAAAERIIAVRNGCDDEPLPVPARTHRFVVRYAGSIYLDRDPRPLFQAAAELVRSEELTPADFSLEFMGEVGTHDGTPLEQLAEQAGIGGFVRCHPSRPRPEALEFLAGATMLVLLPQDSDMAIPAKLFEYLRYPAWLLALAEPESATAQVLQDSAADVVSAADHSAMLAVLRRRFHEHRDGVVPPLLAQDLRFSRAMQAAVLFEALERIGRVAPVPHPVTA